MQVFKLLLLTTCIAIISCKKNSQNNGGGIVDKTVWTIMSNPTDPLFAIAKTDTSQIEFYGDRDAGGIPTKLRLFIVKTRTDTLIYRLDETGRPLTIQNTNGIQFKYDWKSAKQADLTVTSKDAQYIINAPVTIARANNNSHQILRPVNTLGTNNLTVNIINCGTPVTTDIGDVEIELKVVQGNQERTTLPAYFVNGKYLASLPQKVTSSLIPSPDVCDKIKDVLSTACDLNQPGGNVILEASCTSLGIALTLGGVTLPAAAALEAACAVFTKGFDIYCQTVGPQAFSNGDSFANRICDAKFDKRVYDQGIYLQPYIYHNGKKVMGELLSTIGGSQSIDLKLEIKDCITLTTTDVSSVTSTSAISGGNITSDGGSAITERGVCWSTSQNPTIGNSTIIDNGTGVGSFTSSIIDLILNTTYYVRAYATNSAGTAYGNEVGFTTSTNDVIGLTKWRGYYNSFNGGYPPDYKFYGEMQVNITSQLNVSMGWNPSVDGTPNNINTNYFAFGFSGTINSTYNSMILREVTDPWTISGSQMTGSGIINPNTTFTFHLTKQ